MDVLAFISSVIGSVAWPVTLLAILFVILRHGGKIAIFVKSIRYKDIEVTLRDDFEKARDIADGIEGTLDRSTYDETVSVAESEVVKLAKIDPGLAILKIWQKLEAKLIQLIQHNGLMRFTTPQKFVRRLQELEKLTSKDEELFERLRRIRNEAVHGNERQRSLNVAEVVEYDQLVETLVRRLEQIRNEPGYIAPD